MTEGLGFCYVLSWFHSLCFTLVSCLASDDVDVAPCLCPEVSAHFLTSIVYTEVFVQQSVLTSELLQNYYNLLVFLFLGSGPSAPPAL